MTTKKTLALMLLFFIGIPTVAESSQFPYVNILEPKTRVIIDEDTKKVILGDNANSMSNCDVTEKFYCLRNLYILFAIPRGAVFPRSWIFDGQRFDYVGEQNLNLLGRKMSVAVVDVVRQDVEFRFYYSKNAGLLAFRTTIRSSNQTSFFLSELQFGYRLKGSE